MTQTAVAQVLSPKATDTSVLPNLLLVDDESAILSTLSRVLRDEFNLFTATNADDALEIVKSNTIHVVLSDQRMPKTSGVELLKKVALVSPATMRILLTGYSDLTAVQDAINDSAIFRYITKPWRNEKLRTTLKEAASIALAQPAATDPTVAAAETPASIDDKSRILFWNAQIDDGDLHEIKDSIVKLANNRLSIQTVHSSNEAAQILTGENIAVLVVYLSLGESQSILQFINYLKERHPRLMVIAITPMADMGQAVDLINFCQVYRYHHLPLKPALLRLSILSAIDYRNKNLASGDFTRRHQVEPLPENLLKENKILDFLKRTFKKNS